jgi:hypothetical protein
MQTDLVRSAKEDMGVRDEHATIASFDVDAFSATCGTKYKVDIVYDCILSLCDLDGISYTAGRKKEWILDSRIQYFCPLPLPPT